MSSNSIFGHRSDRGYVHVPSQRVTEPLAGAPPCNEAIRAQINDFMDSMERAIEECKAEQREQTIHSMTAMQRDFWTFKTEHEARIDSLIHGFFAASMTQLNATLANAIEAFKKEHMTQSTEPMAQLNESVAAMKNAFTALGTAQEARINESVAQTVEALGKAQTKHFNGVIKNTLGEFKAQTDASMTRAIEAVRIAQTVQINAAVAKAVEPLMQRIEEQNQRICFLQHKITTCEMFFSNIARFNVGLHTLRPSAANSTVSNPTGE